MNKALRSTLHHAADVIDRYADELRNSHVVNGTWKGEGVTKVRDEWADLLNTARLLRAAAGPRPTNHQAPAWHEDELPHHPDHHDET